MPVLTAAERSAREVRAQLARADVTRTALADHLKISRTATARRLRGEIPFDVEELDAIASLLGVPASTFLPEPEQVAS